MKKVTTQKIKEWMKTLEENKWRKTYDVDARRITHFVNYGEGVELPKSLQKKSKNANYIREADMAKRFVKHIKEQDKRKKINVVESLLRTKIRKILRSNT
tara:strand:- start:31 stop:330 length:300 start_codon:yes stop_codon:yes gene_type:complete